MHRGRNCVCGASRKSARGTSAIRACNADGGCSLYAIEELCQQTGKCTWLKGISLWSLCSLTGLSPAAPTRREGPSLLFCSLRFFCAGLGMQWANRYNVAQGSSMADTARASGPGGQAGHGAKEGAAGFYFISDAATAPTRGAHRGMGAATEMHQGGVAEECANSVAHRS